MKYLFFIVLALSFLSESLFAESSPKLRCIALDENDDVTLTWTTPNDTGNKFNAFIIYYQSAAAQQFNPISQVFDYNQNSVTINGSFSGAGSFFIVTDTGSFPRDTSEAIDTLSPIIISLFSSGRNVELAWLQSDIESFDSSYSIYRRVLGGLWALIKSIPKDQINFKDTVDVCEGEFEYKLEFNGIGGCLSRSNISYKKVVDDQAPNPNNLVCASVDTSSGFVNMEWLPSSSKDVFGYTLFYYEDFFWRDTVFGDSNLSFTMSDFGIDALSRVETLSVAPFDSCFNINTQGYNQSPTDLRFQTLYTELVSIDRCQGQCTLKWNTGSEGFPVAVRNTSGYKVYRQADQGSSEVVAILAPKDSIYIDQGLKIGREYTYVVAALDSSFGKEALGNKVKVTLGSIKLPETFYIKAVQNNHATSNNQVLVFMDTASAISKHRLSRSFSPENGFQTISAEDYELVEEFSLIDETGQADQAAYYYRVDAYDECDVFVGSSNVVRSILVEGTKDQKNYLNELFWNEYSGFNADVLGYRLFRNSARNGPEELYFGHETTEFDDDLSDVQNLDGEICYYIEALEEEGNQFGLSGLSRSNLFCVEYSPKIFLPNAFTPDGDGINDVFLPYANYVDQVDYRLVIYNRTGIKVYETNDSQQGWSGSGLDVGVYVYILQVTNAFGETKEFREKVNLIR